MCQWLAGSISGSQWHQRTLQATFVFMSVDHPFVFVVVIIIIIVRLRWVERIKKNIGTLGYWNHYPISNWTALFHHHASVAPTSIWLGVVCACVRLHENDPAGLADDDRTWPDGSNVIFFYCFSMCKRHQNNENTTHRLARTQSWRMCDFVRARLLPS